MSQPEMRRGGTFRRGRAQSAEPPGRAFPHGDWSEPAERLEEVYDWVEQHALRLIDLYLRGRVRKRRGARALRAGAALGAAAGSVLPLLTLAGTLPDGAAAWGYLALLAAGACLAGDRFFGLTAGWMRDVATAQALQRRLETLQFDWAAEAVREALGPTEGSAGEAAGRGLDLLRRYAEDVAEIVRGETADWMLQSAPGSFPLRAQWAAPRSARLPDAGPQSGSRYAVPPGVRPSMPRQRPPEDFL